MDASVRHNIFGRDYKAMKSKAFEFISTEAQRKGFGTTHFWEQIAKQGGLKSVVKEKSAATLHHISSSKLMNLARSKIGKGGLVAAAGLVGWNLIQHSIKAATMPSPAIPRNYDRGYDILRNNMTDFGSPVKLAKAAAKIITPYKSAVRRGTYTTCRSVRNKNIALRMSDNAIGHHKF